MASRKNVEVWKIIKNDLECKIGNENISDITVNDKTYDNPIVIANKFNENFANIRNKYPKTGNPDLAASKIKNAKSNSFDFNPVTKFKVQSIFEQLNKKAAPGLDQIPNKLLLDNLELLLDPIVEGVNEMISSGNFPESLKLTKIFPLHKKGSKKDLDNYRPIALLPYLSKIFEKTLHNQIYSYFEENNLFTPSQFGFRKGKSTDRAVMTFINKVRQIKNSGSKESIVSIQFDLSKAFDLVDHDILLKKLSKYGFTDKACNLIQNYLSGRFQLTEVTKNGKKYHSDLIPCNNSLPQGSILAPLLFLIYINDLPDSLEGNSINLSTVIFADDINVVIQGKDIVNKIKWTMEKVNEWVEANNLKLNIDKTFILNFTKKVLDFESVDFEGRKIKTDQSVKYLGFQVDQKLNWHAHANYIESKIASRMYVIRKLQKRIDKDSLMLYYHANVGSIINYGVHLWGESTETNNILLTQKKILRTIMNKKKFDSCRKLFPELKVMTVFSRYLFVSIKESIKLGFISKDKLISQSRIQTRNILAKVAKTKGEKTDWESLECRSSRFFNKLPNPLKEIFVKSDNSNLFFNQLKNFFLQNPFYSVKEFLELKQGDSIFSVS